MGLCFVFPRYRTTVSFILSSALDGWRDGGTSRDQRPTEEDDQSPTLGPTSQPRQTSNDARADAIIINIARYSGTLALSVSLSLSLSPFPVPLPPSHHLRPIVATPIIPPRFSSPPPPSPSSVYYESEWGSEKRSFCSGEEKNRRQVLYALMFMCIFSWFFSFFCAFLPLVFLGIFSLPFLYLLLFVLRWRLLLSSSSSSSSPFRIFKVEEGKYPFPWEEEEEPLLKIRVDVKKGRRFPENVRTGILNKVIFTPLPPPPVVFTPILRYLSFHPSPTRPPPFAKG